MPTSRPATGEVLDGLWRFISIHPDWTDENDGWDPEVAWWAIRADPGLVLIDPLVSDWEALDALVEAAGGCAGIIRTTFWHERTIGAARERYATAVWAHRPTSGTPALPFDHLARPGEEMLGGLRALEVLRDDEVGVWLPAQRALLFGDVMNREPDGRLRMCPEGWIERAGGHPALRAALTPLGDLEPEHVLVSHGPLRLGGGPDEFARALSA